MDIQPIIKIHEKHREIMVFIYSIAIIIFTFFIAREISSRSYLRADLTCYTVLHGYTAYDPLLVGENVSWIGSWGREGSIVIEGWIYNLGPEDVNVTLHLWIYDGTKNGGGIGCNQSEYWQSNYIPIGVVPKHGKKWIHIEKRYNPFDPTTASFDYELIAKPLFYSGP